MTSNSKNTEDDDDDNEKEKKKEGDKEEDVKGVCGGGVCTPCSACQHCNTRLDTPDSMLETSAIRLENKHATCGTRVETNGSTANTNGRV